MPTVQVLPSKDFSAEEAVRVQLEALKNNNQPWYEALGQLPDAERRL